jgi:hypothetical protein
MRLLFSPHPYYSLHAAASLFMLVLEVGMEGIGGVFTKRTDLRSEIGVKHLAIKICPAHLDGLPMHPD